MSNMIIEVYSKKREEIYRDSILCAYNISTKRIIEIGNEAEKYQNQEDICVTSGMKLGRVSDVDIFGIIIAYHIKKAINSKKSFFKPKIYVCLPNCYELSDTDKEIFIDAFCYAQARDVIVENTDFKKLIKSKEKSKNINVILINIKIEDSEEFLSDMILAVKRYAEKAGVSKKNAINMFEKLM